MTQRTDSWEHGAGSSVLAALLAVPGIIAHGAWMLASFEEWHYGVEPLEAIGGLGNLLVVVLLGAGTVVLLLRRRIGRWMVTAGAAGGLVMIVGGIALMLVILVRTEDGSTAGFLKLGITFLSPALCGPVLALVLVLSPRTGEWLRRRNGVPAEAEHGRG
ncbi:hypothetical protein FHR84_002377 [Actinopolyspora biskrensis]|uniref:Uncharacterized protein n=1 Tax=Actinopolyspora biskrensis TaxID=1470178 RepID=A0A852ZAD1_9ACTN|nr:hypothetical protein [Actinopolyspora biskrensis]NYH79043.1 hypothetical protein [Actinopolyspora biskrensis]